MIPSSGCPPWPPDHPRTLPRTGTPTPPRGARPWAIRLGRLLWPHITSGRVAQRDRASAVEAERCRFKPCFGRQCLLIRAVLRGSVFLTRTLPRTSRVGSDVLTHDARPQLPSQDHRGGSETFPYTRRTAAA